MSRAWLGSIHEYTLFVLLPYVTFHSSVHFVDVDRYLGLRVARIVGFVRCCVANALHVLLLSILSQTPSDTSSYIHLRVVPFVHAQRFDLRDVCPKFAVKRSAAHAQKDAQLGLSVPLRDGKGPVESRDSSRTVLEKTYAPACPSYSLVSSSPPACTLSLPGFFAPQSAQVPLPGTVLISSCSVRSLRACWRLFRAEAMSSRRGRHTRVGAPFVTRAVIERAYAAGARGCSSQTRRRTRSTALGMIIDMHAGTSQRRAGHEKEERRPRRVA